MLSTPRWWISINSGDDFGSFLVHTPLTTCWASRFIHQRVYSRKFSCWLFLVNGARMAAGDFHDSSWNFSKKLSKSSPNVMNSYLMDYWKWLTKALNGGVIKACLRDICDIMNLSREFSMMKIDVKSFRIIEFIDKTLSLLTVNHIDRVIPRLRVLSTSN